MGILFITHDGCEFLDLSVEISGRVNDVLDIRLLIRIITRYLLRL